METVLGPSKQRNIIKDIGGNINIRQPNFDGETESMNKINAARYTGNLCAIRLCIHYFTTDACIVS